MQIDYIVVIIELTRIVSTQKIVYYFHFVTQNKVIIRLRLIYHALQILENADKHSTYPD